MPVLQGACTDVGSRQRLEQVVEQTPATKKSLFLVIPFILV